MELLGRISASKFINKNWHTKKSARLRNKLSLFEDWENGLIFKSNLILKACLQKTNSLIFVGKFRTLTPSEVDPNTECIEQSQGSGLEGGSMSPAKTAAADSTPFPQLSEIQIV